MAGRTSTSSSSRNGSRGDSLDKEQVESLVSNVQFMQLLRRLPDEMTRLERENKTLKREASASPSRVDASSKKIEKWWESWWRTREQQLISEQEERIVQLRVHYEQQLKNNTEVLQKNNNQLQSLLTERSGENEKLKQRLHKCEQQLREQASTTVKHQNGVQGFAYKQQMLKAKQALEEKRKELDSFKERHAAFSERRVRSDQRRTENTLSRSRQSQLESEYVTEFKDGSRVDAIDIMTTRLRRFGRTSSTSLDYLKCCRLACFIFETAYEVAVEIKESFANFTSTVLQTLVTDAPAIGSDNKTFQRKLLRQQYDRQLKDIELRTRDALSEVFILVKEEAKDHDLNFLVRSVKHSIVTNWKRHDYLQADNLLLKYDTTLLDELNDFINYCTRFAWCTLTQVPPMKIDYSTSVYSSRSHMVSQAFTSSEERNPTRRPIYPEAQNVLCYLWPVLLDCDGNVIRKGEVVLDGYR